MPFQIDDQVVYPAFGVGRVVGLVTKSFSAAGSRLYYEVSGYRTTAWVEVDRGAAVGLRPLTRRDELAHFRSVLRGRPAALNTDFRQRQLEVRSQLRRGTLQGACEVVRDLSGRGWIKPLNEADASVLRTTLEALCQEWAASDSVSLERATAEVNGLLREARQTFQPGPRPDGGRLLAEDL